MREDPLEELCQQAMSMGLMDERTYDGLTDDIASGVTSESDAMQRWSAIIGTQRGTPPVAQFSRETVVATPSSTASLALELETPSAPNTLEPQQPNVSCDVVDTSDASTMSGLLLTMCSEVEAREREACRELSVLEQQRGSEATQRRPTVDVALAVKRYQRPAAGAPPPAIAELRPLHVLQRTVEYLLTLWTTRDDVPAISRYVFISDRLRAVQQDMTIQRLRSGALLARIVRFHLLMEAEFSSTPQAAALGFSAVQNRSLLCNALTSALEEPGALSVSLHSELLAYFVLLHADEPQTMLPELGRAPQNATGDAAVRRALRLVGPLVRDDAAGVIAAIQHCTLLEVACVLRLLPQARAAILQQCNLAYSSREALPLGGLCRRLWLADPDGVERALAAHGLPLAEAVEHRTPPHSMDKEDASAVKSMPCVRFKAAGFVLRPAKPIEPPLAPAISQVTGWLQRSQAAQVGAIDVAAMAYASRSPTMQSGSSVAGFAAPVSSSSAGVCVCSLPSLQPLPEADRLERKKKRRPPPKDLLAVEQVAGID